jgi:hypothetical protein
MREELRVHLTAEGRDLCRALCARLGIHGELTLLFLVATRGRDELAARLDDDGRVMLDRLVAFITADTTQELTEMNDRPR